MFKKILKDKKVYISAAIMFVLGLIPFFVAMIMDISSNGMFQFLGYPYATWGIFVLYFFIGYAWGDLHIARARHNLKIYDGKLPEDVRFGAWKRRTPFFLAASVLFILALSLEISRLILGFYIFA